MTIAQLSVSDLGKFMANGNYVDRMIELMKYYCPTDSIVSSYKISVCDVPDTPLRGWEIPEMSKLVTVLNEIRDVIRSMRIQDTYEIIIEYSHDTQDFSISTVRFDMGEECEWGHCGGIPEIQMVYTGYSEDVIRKQLQQLIEIKAPLVTDGDYYPIPYPDNPEA